MPIPEGCRIAVIGGAGLVGRELISVLQDMGASPRIATTPPPDCELCMLATPEQASVAIFNASTHGLFIDLSSAFRGDLAVPLVVPSLNAAGLRSPSRLIASPNCTATILSLAIAPLIPWGLGRVVVTTCQAASGAGEAALTALEAETRAALDGCGDAGDSWAFNTFCHESAIDASTGRSGEEQKVIDETRRILDLPQLDISPTCLRVPVRRAHVASITVELMSDITLEAVRGAFQTGADLRLLDDPATRGLPSTRSAEHRDTVDVGHIRLDGRRVSFVAAGDQLRIGAALNAARIAACLLTTAGDDQPPA